MSRIEQKSLTLAFVTLGTILGFAFYDDPWREKLLLIFPILILYVLTQILVVLVDIREAISGKDLDA